MRMQGMQEDKIHLAARDLSADTASLIDGLRTINRRGFSRATKLAPLLSRLELASELTVPLRGLA